MIDTSMPCPDLPGLNEIGIYPATARTSDGDVTASVTLVRCWRADSSRPAAPLRVDLTVASDSSSAVEHELLLRETASIGPLTFPQEAESMVVSYRTLGSSEIVLIEDLPSAVGDSPPVSDFALGVLVGVVVPLSLGVARALFNRRARYLAAVKPGVMAISQGVQAVDDERVRDGVRLLDEAGVTSGWCSRLAADSRSWISDPATRTDTANRISTRVRRNMWKLR